MELNAIIDQVTKEVMQYMNQIEQKPEILMLAEKHSTKCHKLLKKYNELGLACGVMTEKENSLDDIKVIILFDITNDVLYKLAQGCSETPYLKLASQALLRGKQVILVKEEIEIFKYEKSAPSLYFNKIMEHLDFLEKCGVAVACEKDIPLYLEVRKLERQIKEETKKELEPKQSAETFTVQSATVKINKRLITEREVQEAVRNGAKVIAVMPRAIITQLAKDAIQTYNICLLEQMDEL